MGVKSNKATELPDGTLVVQNVEGGLGSIRCPACRGLATSHIRQDGQRVNKCDRCRREWTSKAFK